MGGRGAYAKWLSGYRARSRPAFASNAIPKSTAYINKTFSRGFAKGMVENLKKAPEQVRKLWELMAERLFYVGPATLQGGGLTDAWYSPFSKGVYFDTRVVQEGDIIHTPYNTAFHEFAHQMDYYIGELSTGAIDQAFTDISGKIQRAIVVDVNNLMFDARNSLIANGANPSSLTDKTIAKTVLDLIQPGGAFPERWNSDISDMLEAGFQLRKNPVDIGYPLGSGHGTAYWYSHGGNKEAFAEIVASFTNQDSNKAIQKYFPNAYKATLSELEAIVDAASTIPADAQLIY